jgi:hypothetical protein
MVAAIRQLVTEGSDGRIEIRAPELRAGAQAEVIVLMQDTSSAGVVALDLLQNAMKLDAAGAARWTEQVKAERAAFGEC